MSLPVTVPFTFGNATTTQSLSSLDTNFTTITNSVNGLTNGASKINVASITATGTANSVTYLRGDGTWATVSGGGGIGNGTVTSVNANSTIGFTFTGGPVTSSGTLTLSGPTPGTSGNVLTSNGTAWVSQAFSGGAITSGTTVSASGSASVDFTGIPSTAKRITVIFMGISSNGSSNFQIQIGSGSITSSGYVSAGFTPVANYSSSTTGFVLTGGNGASTFYYGTLTIVAMGSNVYVESGILGGTGGGNASSGGGVTLSGILDRVRVTTVNGTDLFDAGSINIFYE